MELKKSKEWFFIIGIVRKIKLKTTKYSVVFGLGVINFSRSIY